MKTLQALRIPIARITYAETITRVGPFSRKKSKDFFGFDVSARFEVGKVSKKIFAGKNLREFFGMV